MSETNRRKFLAATGVTAAAGGVALVGGSAAHAAATPHPHRAREQVMAVVDDPHGDVVTLLVGEGEVVVRDRDLVTRILNAAGGK